MAKPKSKIDDVIIIGAGISGINAAYRLQSQVSEINYSILEGRSQIGGTWDLFRYPGIRSDTDLLSFGFVWNLWTENTAIASGNSIAQYLKETAATQRIDKHIKLNHQVVSANWSSKDQLWKLIVSVDRVDLIEFQARFIILGTGYYDYTKPLAALVPGLRENFKGQIVSPQFWPPGFDYSGKKVVIIGSGATAITLLPNLAKKAGHVTMLQRSPTYILTIDNAIGDSWLYKALPKSWALKISRLIFIGMTCLIYYLCRAFPSRARRNLETAVAQQLPARVPFEPHFKPSYQPWDQRVCFTPNGDFFQCLKNENTAIQTGRIENVDSHEIILQSGEKIEADIIITATGLKLQIGGNIKFSIDDKPIDLTDRYAWKSAMLQDVPNLSFMLGYVNVSWTLGADVTAHLVCRILRRMKRTNSGVVIPRLPQGSSIEPRLIWSLNATYVHSSTAQMPKCGNYGPWKGRTNYFQDLWRARYGDIMEGLELMPADRSWKFGCQ